MRKKIPTATVTFKSGETVSLPVSFLMAEQGNLSIETLIPEERIYVKLSKIKRIEIE
jgi:hypothetical protein